eukprot:398248_1
MAKHGNTILTTIIILICTSYISSICGQMSYTFTSDKNIRGKSTSINCTAEQQCKVFCTGLRACYTATIYLENVTSVECTGQESCYGIRIYSDGTVPIQLTFSGQSACYGVEAFIKHSYQQIATTCENYVSGDACDMEHLCSAAVSQFYYTGIMSTVQHHCNSPGSCGYTIIEAVNSNSLLLECGTNGACNNMNIYLPVLITSSMSTILIRETSENVNNKLFSFNGINNLIISCSGFEGWCHTDTFYVIYGLAMDMSCTGSNTTCLASKEIKYYLNDWTTHNITTIYANEKMDLDFSDNVSSGAFVIIVPKLDRNGNVLLSPTFASFTSIICIDGHVPIGVSTACDGMIFNLTSSYDAAFIANNAQDCTFYGPLHTFKRVSYDFRSKNGIYHLEKTQNIDFASDSNIAQGMFAKESEMYVGSSISVKVHCVNDMDCYQNYIYSSLIANTYTSLIDIGWEIIMYPPQKIQSSAVLHINFTSINQICDISYNTPSECGFLTASPTSSPTTFNPTISPTTSNPTINTTFDSSIGSSHQ